MNPNPPPVSSAPVRPATSPYDIVVFCHLRWDFVYQRPQHIISRLAKDHRVLVVEEPWRRQDESGHHLRSASANLDVLQPNVDHIEQIASALTEYLPGGEVDIAWFYSPSFVGVLEGLTPGVIVYDCMDELSLFRGAPPALIQQEAELLARADVVFTGGRSLYEAKRQRHDNAYCFPSSVDRAHFAQALGGVDIPGDLARLSEPVVGYFGVIDERIDLGLLAGAAALRPEVQFVMIGPLAKIHPHDLPQAGNIHYLGMRDYKELPSYLAGFDVAMMPFALNDSTTFISPTKTLEYMAAGRPIVSTAIADVVSEYSEVVAIVDSAESMVAAIDEALADASPRDYDAILDATSWDSTVHRMQGIISKQTVS